MLGALALNTGGLRNILPKRPTVVGELVVVIRPRGKTPPWDAMPVAVVEGGCWSCGPAIRFLLRFERYINERVR
jgi:hypothetical protein